MSKKCECGHAESNHSSVGDRSCCVLLGEENGEGVGCNCPAFRPVDTVAIGNLPKPGDQS
jgi:hypothetical protein